MFTLDGNALTTDKDISTTGIITSAGFNSIINQNFAISLKGSSTFVVKDTNGGSVLSVSQTGKINIKESENGSVGKAKIADGAIEIKVENTSITQNSRIFVTPDQLVTYRIKEKVAGQSFTIEISAPASSDINFDYFIVN